MECAVCNSRSRPWLIRAGNGCFAECAGHRSTPALLIMLRPEHWVRRLASIQLSSPRPSKKGIAETSISGRMRHKAHNGLRSIQDRSYRQNVLKPEPFDCRTGQKMGWNRNRRDVDRHPHVAVRSEQNCSRRHGVEGLSKKHQAGYVFLYLLYIPENLLFITAYIQGSFIWPLLRTPSKGGHPSRF